MSPFSTYEIGNSSPTKAESVDSHIVKDYESKTNVKNYHEESAGNNIPYVVQLLKHKFSLYNCQGIF